jgi:hypothetical protein
MNMTYRKLIKLLNKLPDEQKDLSVTVYLSEADEFMPIESMEMVNNSDVLDSPHPVLRTPTY